MIKPEEVVKIGQFGKPHGIGGELSFSFSNDCFDENECPFLICEMNGILVPFAMECYRFKSDLTAFVQLQGIDTEDKAKQFTNLDVFFPKKAIVSTDDEDNQEYSWMHFVGYTLIDESSGSIGTVTDVDESTLNTLFLVNRNNKEILLPAVTELIVDVDHLQKTITLQLPAGILSIDE